MQPTALDAATLEKLISAAVAAPSIHNTQPWRYRLDPDTATLEVQAVVERTLPYADPMGRALHISVGAALFNLRVAVAHFGWEPVVRLLPHPADPCVLAAVRLAGPPRGGHEHRPDLYDVIWRRHTSRFPFTDAEIPPAVLTELREAATIEGATLHLPGPVETDRLLHLTAEAERRNSTDAERTAEARAWIRESSRVGMPKAALGPQDARGYVPVRDFGGLDPEEHQPTAVFEQHPTIGVLTTTYDRPADWLRAGQALEHLLLVATTHNVRASLLHQAVEWADLRWALRDTHHGPSHVQVLVRLGYGPEGAATPRQPVAEVLTGDLPG